MVLDGVGVDVGWVVGVAVGVIVDTTSLRVGVREEVAVGVVEVEAVGEDG